MTLNELNQLDPQAAATCFQQCCVSEAWVQGMSQARPFSNEAALFAEASRIWAGLKKSDYLQAFEGHPKIGDVSSLRTKYADTKALAASEQASLESANDATLIALAAGNQQYEARFGYIFIVCATGKSAGEMLALLKQRLSNNPETEIYLAAEEQNKITHIRLQKLLQS